MDTTIQQTAKSFSGGEFELAYPYLSEDVEWHIFGERTLLGKKAVMEYCEQVAAYFKSVTTEFKMYSLLEDANKIAINGIAKFIRNGVTAAVINACDVYEFNESGSIQKIYSYCIHDKIQ
jgi:hypothetical protein